MKRDAADFLVAEHGLPISKACAAVGISRTAFYRRPPSTTTDDPVVDALGRVGTDTGRLARRQKRLRAFRLSPVELTEGETRNLADVLDCPGLCNVGEDVGHTA